MLLLCCVIAAPVTIAYGAEQCPDYSMLSQKPPLTSDLNIRIWANDDLIAAVVAGGGLTYKQMPYALDDFSVPGPISEIIWWGTELDLTQSPAERFAPLFTITFFEKDTSVTPPMPGNVVAEMDVSVNKVNTGLLYLSPITYQFEIPMYRYSYTLPTPLNLPEGYIRIRGKLAGSVDPTDPTNPNKARAFVQVSSPDGNQDLREYNGQDLPYKVRIDPAKQYDVAMCLLPALEEVPDITGLDFAAAEAALQAAGFVVGTVTYDYSGAAPAGQIINQDPAAGLELPAGSTINLVVAAEPSIVPNVVGKTEAEAADLLAAAGLVVGSVSQVYSDTAPAGQVLQQSVAPGSSVAPGTAVNLVLSRGKETTVPAAGAVALVALSAALAGIGLARSRRK